MASAASAAAACVFPFDEIVETNDVPPSAMISFTQHNPRPCLLEDDLDALHALYPDCGHRPTEVVCHKTAHSWRQVVVARRGGWRWNCRSILYGNRRHRFLSWFFRWRFSHVFCCLGRRTADQHAPLGAVDLHAGLVVLPEHDELVDLRGRRHGPWEAPQETRVEHWPGARIQHAAGKGWPVDVPRSTQVVAVRRARLRRVGERDQVHVAGGVDVLVRLHLEDVRRLRVRLGLEAFEGPNQWLHGAWHVRAATVRTRKLGATQLR